MLLFLALNVIDKEAHIMNEFKDIPLSEFSETESASESPSVEKIPEYVPTQWVDETEPDIDADHLNHIEDGIKKVTDGVNNIIENGGGSFVPSDGYVYIDQEESEENPDPVYVPVLDADTFGGQLPSYYAPQHEISDAFSEGRDYATGDYCIQSNTLYRFTSSKPAGAWDGTKAVPVTVSQELANLNSNFSWKLLRTLDISNNENVDVPYNSNAVHEFMVSYGRKNGEQAYGGAVVTIAASENKPCFCPLYVNDSLIATVYIANAKNEKSIRLSRYSGTDTIRCWVYYR